MSKRPSIPLVPIKLARDLTVVLIRHAERGAGVDPSLTPAGHARAQELINVLGDAGISTIYVTEFVRTQQTAAPLAAHLGITPVQINVAPDVAAHVTAVASDIRTRRRGKRVLVVGHTNTVPEIIRELGFTGSVSIPDTAFDRLFVFWRRSPGTARLVRARYGA